MGLSSARRVRKAVLPLTTATALAAALAAAAPAARADVAGPARSGEFRAAVTQRPEVVTLVTGDRVLVRHDAAGRTFASLLPGSPHYGKRVEFVNTPDHTWVVPRLSRSARDRFDSSLFDVAALAGRRRVALQVTFAKGTAPRSVPGLGVHLATAHRGASGRTTVRASYDAHRPLPADLAGSLHGVRRIALADRAAAPAPDYVLNTLTIDATTVGGKPLAASDVFVINADNAQLFDTMGGILEGQWKVSVPAGNYFVVISTFDRVVVHEVNVGDADTETSLSMSEATVKPRMQAPPTFKAADPELSISGVDQSGTAHFGFGFGGSFPRLSPITDLAAGSLTTEVANTWVPRRYQPVTFGHGQPKTHAVTRIVAAKQARPGIPTRLVFPYHAGDYAHVAIKHYATGPKQHSYDTWSALAPGDTDIFGLFFPTVRPGVVHASLLGDKDLRWISSTTLSSSLRTFGELDATASYHAGKHASVRFLRGPVAPVADVGGESKHVSYACQLCVIDGTMGGAMSMVSSAGTDQFGVDDHGRFTVSRGRRLLAKGNTFLAPVVDGVKPGQRLRMTASTTPPDPKFVLSSRVSDTWRFAVPSGARAIVPLLRAAYVVPTDLRGVGRPGLVSFPVTFDNLGPVDARVAKASVRWSVDGRHWTAASLKRTGKSSFRASYRNPAATKAHPYLSLEVSAKDTAGRTVDETVAHAYVLPHGSPRAARSGAQTHRRFHPGTLCRTSGKHAYSCFVKLGRRTRSAGRAASNPAGWGATSLRDAYDIGDPKGPTGTIAVIDAFGYPHAQRDMNAYRAQYGLPACTGTSGCFQKVNQDGVAGSYPPKDYDWGVETALDLQMVSAACPTCHIVLVEADDPSDASFFTAEQTAVDKGATVTSHSFGRIELTGAETDAESFDHPGVTAVASTGDNGYGPASFPASSPEVVAVGGTELSHSTDPRGWSEQAWSSASSGCSAYFAKPAGQPGTACRNRSTADLSAVASGIAVYDTSLPKRYRGWLTVDGTSASTPLVAGMIASVDGGGLRPADLYAEYTGDASTFNDAVGGSNGFCEGSYLCTGVAGYDGPTGLGTPTSPGIFAPAP